MTQLCTTTIKTAGETLQWICHGQAKKNGWWSDMTSGADLTSKGYPLVRPVKNVGEQMALLHTEVAEATEGDRRNRMDEHLPHRTSLEVELADVVIRVFDLSGGWGLDVAGAIAEKLQYNSTRKDHTIESRRAVDGKKF